VEAPNSIVSQTYGKAVGVGLGAGYKYQWLRGDLTFDYGTRANYRGTTAAAAAQPQYASRNDSFVMLANVYFDMGTWAGFTPYVGGGVGASYLRSTGTTDTTLPAGELVPIGSKLNPSWAGMAGVSFQATPTWVLDVGYRYVNLGDLQSGVDSQSGFTTWRKLSAQEIRVGFRLLLD
jgi:opacity protein-like surface antigen